jgi:hypothetical protein
MRLTFGRLPPADVERLLVRDHGHAPDEARRIAMLADGSIGAALALGSQALAETRDAATALLGAAAAPDLAGRLAVAKFVVGEKKERSRLEVQAVLGVAASVVRDVAALHAGADRRLLANGDIPDVLGRFTRLLTPPRARAAFATLDRGRSALDRNAGTKLVVEWIAAEL